MPRVGVGAPSRPTVRLDAVVGIGTDLDRRGTLQRTGHPGHRGGRGHRRCRPLSAWPSVGNAATAEITGVLHGTVRRTDALRPIAGRARDVAAPPTAT